MCDAPWWCALGRRGVGCNAAQMFHRTLSLRRSALSGRGVFAAADLPAHTAVEVSPVLLVPLTEAAQARSLLPFWFEWDANVAALALGWGEWFNHGGAAANCGYLRAEDDATIAQLVGSQLVGCESVENFAPAFVFITRRAVLAGEELTTDYSGRGEAAFPFPA